MVRDASGGAAFAAAVGRGVESVCDWSRLGATTPEQRHTAAVADPDAQPLTEADMDRMKPTPLLKIIRRALGLTQEEFAARFLIPIRTLQDREQGRMRWTSRRGLI